MVITLESKKDNFLEKTIKAFNKKDLNDARQSAEVFCKIILLKEFNENEANQIINNQHAVIKQFDLNTAIESILFKNKIKNKSLIDKKVKSYLSVLQNHGNLDSHDDDFSKLDIDEIEYGLFHLSKLIKFLYNEYLDEDIPKKLDLLLIKFVDILQKKIEKKNTDWLEIQKITNEFDLQQQRFMLVTDKCKDESLLSNLSNINWSYIGDFDKDSHKNGLYFHLKSELSQYRDTNIITINEPLIYSKSTTFWEFLNGYSERAETLEDTYRKWQRKYINSNKINNHIDELYNGGISTSDVFIFIFWEEEKILDYLFDYLNILDGIFIESTHLIFLSTKELVREKISNELKQYENITKSSVYNLSIENFSLLLKNRKKININDITLPALIDNIESSIEIKSSDFLRYKDDLKIFPFSYENDCIECNDYYQGHLINFKNLHNDCDILRTIGKEIESVIRNRLNNRNSQLIYLLSEPSAGTTTISYRILWEIRDKYPSIELLNYRKRHTYEFLQQVYSKTNKPLLIFADHKIHEEDIKKLISELNSKRITYVLLYVTRFLDKRELNGYKKELSNTPSKLPFHIFENLDKRENDKFYRKLSQNYFSKKDELLELKNKNNTSPFIYNFSIFLDEYQNIDTYIKDKIDNLSEFKKNRIKYLALIQYYIGLDVTVKFLTGKRNKSSLFSENDTINNLLIYEEIDDELKVEFIHHSICEKILIYLTKVQEHRAWKQKLVELGIDFLEFIEKSHQHNKNNEVIRDITNRLFIKRNITTYDSDKRGAIKYYTDFIEDLNETNNSLDAREKIFKKLVEIYPEDRHYLAHLGRFYSVDKNNFTKSLEYINRAIQLAENEGKVDSILSHMKGMVYFRELEYKKREKESLDEIIKLGKKSAEYFILSREHDTQINNDYPFITHARMLLSILEYGKQNNEDDIYKFIDKYKDDAFIVNIIDDIENLISDFEVIRTKSDDYTNMKQIKNRLWELQGDIGKSLEMLNNLLVKNTYYNPVLRRNIARLTVKKYKENIDNIPRKTIDTLIQHLRKNLDGFSLMESNSTDLLLWLRLIRHKDITLDILDISEILSYIKIILDEEIHLTKVQKNIQIIVLYYLHIIKFIQYNNEDNDVYSEFIEIKKELKSKAMFLDGKSLAREWLHNEKKNSIKEVINWYDKKLKWINKDKFFNSDSQQYLERCHGIIKEVKNAKTGVILYKKIEIHFIPRTEFTKSNHNEKVSFYLSFSYDEMSAWKVEKI